MAEDEPEPGPAPARCAQTEQRERTAAASTAGDSFLDRLRSWGSGWAFTGADSFFGLLLERLVDESAGPS